MKIIDKIRRQLAELPGNHVEYTVEQSARHAELAQEIEDEISQRNRLLSQKDAELERMQNRLAKVEEELCRLSPRE